MKDRLEKLYRQNVIELAIILIPIFEVITSLTKRTFTLNISIGILYKAILVVMSLIYVLFINKKNRKGILLIICSLIIYSMVNLIIVGLELKTFGDLCKMFSFILPCMFFYCYRENGNEIRIKSLVYVTLIYCILVKLADITGTQFATYANNKALGSKGWFYSGNELTAILAITLPIVIYYGIHKINFMGIATVFLQIHVLLSTGTKTSIIAVCLIIVFLLIYSPIRFIITKDIKYGKMLAICSILLIFVAVILPETASFKFLKKRVELATEEISPEGSEQIEEVGENSTNVAINKLLFNGRQDFLTEQKRLYVNSNALERLFGLKSENRFGYNLDAKYKPIEIDMFDVAIVFGLIGFMIVYMPLVYCIIVCIYSAIKIDKPKPNDDVLIFLLSIFIAICISSIAGHVLTSSTIVIFLALILSYVHTRKKEKVIK